MTDTADHRPAGARTGRGLPPRLLRCAAIVGFAVVVGALLVTDVWDETRGLQLVRDHDVVTLVASNWTAGEPGVTLFRPLPMLIVTAVAKAAPSWNAAWAALRALVAGAMLAAALLLVVIARRAAGDGPWRDTALTTGLLLSASGVLAASWFAMAFDVFALLLLVAGTLLVLDRRPTSGGVALAAALLCKESALIAVPVVMVAIAGRVSRTIARRAAIVAVAGGAVALGLRFAIVAPGSAHDLHALSAAGFLAALRRLPAVLWWQVAAPPSVLIGWLATLGYLAGLRSRRALAAALATLVMAGLLYGQMVHLRATPLLDADNFAARLYLIPGAALLLLAALAGRRWLPIVLLAPLLWGGAVTFQRQHAFQQAYLRVQRLAESHAGGLAVDCELYRRPFLDRRRGLALGRYPAAAWRLERDGTLARIIHQ